MLKVIYLGSGAAPGVPSLGSGWLYCNPDNPKNKRRRTSTYVEIDDVKILIDTSPDMRLELIDQNIRSLDAVLYTHAHADHLHGIDDLREINRINCESLNFFAGPKTSKIIKKRFDYLIVKKCQNTNHLRCPSLICNTVKPNHEFFVKKVKITPIKLLEHCCECIGYVFNDGDYVHIADFKKIASSAYKMIKKRPKLLTIPLTTIQGEVQHASLEEVLAVIEKINPKRVVLNHLTNKCDYDNINALTPDFCEAAYDNMQVEIENE